MKNLSLVLVILFLSSCCKPIIDSETLFNNTTNERIELRFYKSGTFFSNFIEAKSTAIAYFSFPYPPSPPADSVQILIKDVHQQTHYSKMINKPSTNIKTLQFENSKNLLNINNYQQTKEALPCNGSHTKYTYTF